MSTPSINIRIDFNVERGVSAHVEQEEVPTPLRSPGLTGLSDDSGLPSPTIDPRSSTPGSSAPMPYPQPGQSDASPDSLPVPSSEVPGLPELGSERNNQPPKPQGNPTNV